MVVADQPTIFGSRVIAGVSSVADGNMKFGIDDDTKTQENRDVFLRRLAIDPANVAVAKVTYETDDFCRYGTILSVGDRVADGLITTEKIALFLPLADCTGAIIYDPIHSVLMISHLGRHSTEQYGGIKSIEHMVYAFESDPSELLVWLSPSPNGIDYPLWKFDHRSFTDVLVEQLLVAGVTRDHIEASTVDTVASPEYFSHSEFLKGRQAIDGRYAIVAMLS